MCTVYNTIGSLAVVKAYLHQHSINEFSSLGEVIKFQNNYTTTRLSLISEHENKIENEMNNLTSDILQLDTTIYNEKIYFEGEQRKEIEILGHKLGTLLVSTPTNFIQKLSLHFKVWHYKGKIKRKELNFDTNIAYSVRKLVEVRTKKDTRYQYVASNFAAAVNESCMVPLTELERKKRIIDEVNNSILGALGEQKVVKELEKLGDEYILINDYCAEFSPAIYHREENEYIKSIQIDHLLIGPSGIFSIETKNWSEKSLNSLNLRSPVKQIRRTGFALFKILHDTKIKDGLKLNYHHWGKRKIPIRNIIVLTNTKPNEEFQFVKILRVNELISYINYFKPSFSHNETKGIANFLLNITR